ncbi:hypothetical protein EXIGLDRAFT_771190 [Exidia glandulosa HHB12029]|uniref:Uncharacterized protein n=1 Tax=Exidia glandulosa HHB12029 TaxID=1314781 RepID=A0A165G6X4_EXIGL|nr:hypothetical protein EXIGLDRAFT_771190 [Exidia glandulosa HHB12029]
MLPDGANGACCHLRVATSPFCIGARSSTAFRFLAVVHEDGHFLKRPQGWLTPQLRREWRVTSVRKCSSGRIALDGLLHEAFDPAACPVVNAACVELLRGTHQAQLARVERLSSVAGAVMHYLNRNRNVTGIEPPFYECIFMLDADTLMTPDSINRLAACTLDDQSIVGICGENEIIQRRRLLVDYDSGLPSQVHARRAHTVAPDAFVTERADHKQRFALQITHCDCGRRTPCHDVKTANFNTTNHQAALCAYDLHNFVERDNDVVTLLRVSGEPFVEDLFSSPGLAVNYAGANYLASHLRAHSSRLRNFRPNPDLLASAYATMARNIGDFVELIASTGSTTTRFADLPFTRPGHSTLVAVNLTKHPANTKERSYGDTSPASNTLPPHPYGHVAGIHLLICRTRQSQSVVLRSVMGIRRDARVAEKVKALDVVLNSFSAAKTFALPSASCVLSLYTSS